MSETVKAHGMDGQLVEPDWPPLTFDEVGELLREFPSAGEASEILSVSPRPLSAGSVVRTTKGRVFVKRHHRSVRDREGLLEEHRFLQHLWAHGGPVPSVLASGAGETAIEKGEWTYEVHDAAEGIDLYEEAVSWTPFRCARHAGAAGEALSRLHLAARGFDAARRKVQPIVASFTIFANENPAGEMERYLAARPRLAESSAVCACAERALEVLAPFHAELVPLLAKLAPLWTHNDLHASNLFWSDATEGAQVRAIVDFGLSDRTNAVYDLAHAIERNMVEWLVLVEDSSRPDAVPVHLDHLHALLEGYEAVRPLSGEEAAALAPMTALCHAEFALSEAEYFLGVLHSDERARMAYDGWLVGHARWFHSAAGRRLLDGVRRWAERRAEAVR
jgi:Ser/Thr protein kinase RdoA (MazF antagonist)